ncbi:hypothetical protein Tco_0921676, partial [Tanacetum coccineum]
MKANHPGKENHDIPNAVYSSTSPGKSSSPDRRNINRTSMTDGLGRGSLGKLIPPNNNSKRTRTPTQLSPVSKQTTVVVGSDIGHISLTPRPKARPRITDISTPADAIVRTVIKQVPPNNNNSKRTRTPSQISPLSKGNNNVFVSESDRIKSTPRPRGRPRMTEISTCSPFPNVTPVGSITFKSTIVNGTVLDKQAFNDTTIKGKSIRKKHASRFINQTPVNFNIESSSTQQVRESSIQTSLLTLDRRKLKGKMNTLTMEILLLNAHLVVHCYGSMRRTTNTCSDSYSLCCGRGKVMLTNEVLEPPPLLKELITDKHPKSAPFIDNIRRYNSMFAFTSMGENYHLVGPLLPENGKPAKFAQLYISDTENEIQNKIGAVSNGESTSSRNIELDYQLTIEIRDLLDEINLLVQDFRMAGERIRSSDDKKVSLRLIGTRQRDGRQYNLPTASEVAALIVGDFDSTEHKRDIILHCQDGDFKRI